MHHTNGVSRGMECVYIRHTPWMSRMMMIIITRLGQRLSQCFLKGQVSLLLAPFFWCRNVATGLLKIPQSKSECVLFAMATIGFR